ncbi:hypothetical protein RFI_35064 [Reticulomyxa filosa]|uniref:Uncharacterized protein n=1 Tax=Reticulomyxa filosa TaxID=46433 RepID=X6LMN2_RETFI|nr:hypothetical protein RFI_35064 [Reticulomyxa filosa]|eukprot:ETO02372.1 hypothetical protein RFI_35064 [Reticulomyxa filosa]
MLNNSNITNEAMHVLPRLIEAKCIAPLDDKNLCGKYIFCSCNDDECKKVSSFVIGHDDTEKKSLKFPRLLTGFAETSATIFTHYVSYFNFWKTRNEPLDFSLKLSQIGVCKDIIIETGTMLSLLYMDNHTNNKDFSEHENNNYDLSKKMIVHSRKIYQKNEILVKLMKKE